MNKFKTSLYTIFVDLKDDSSHSMIIHGYTGAIDKVSKQLFDNLKMGLSKFNYIEDLSTNLRETLIARGYLTLKSPIEEKDYVKKMAETLHKRDKFRKNFMFLVAYDCNFRCPYCFENSISSNGKGWSKKVFTKNAVDKAFKAMFDFEPNINYHSKTIILYGGEPLLVQNKEIVEYIVHKGVELGYSFKAITNGYDLKEFEYLLNDKMINNVQITLDGNKEKHNNRRTHFKDGNSFDKILNNIEIALSKNINVSVRINTELNNFDDLEELNKIFIDKKFSINNKFHAYSALIHGDSEMNCNTIMVNSTDVKDSAQSSIAVDDFGYNEDYKNQYIDFELEEKNFENVYFHDDIQNDIDSLKTMNRIKYMNKYFESVKNDSTMKNIACQDFGLRGKITSAVNNNRLVDFRSVFCSAQTGELIFDPYGDLYTCWETVGIDKYKVGTYREGLNFNEDELNNWYGRNISTTPACSKCKYAFFCGGGCQAHALNEGRGFNSPYCDGYPKMFQEVISDIFQKKETTINE